jgi:hypothetical protein
MLRILSRTSDASVARDRPNDLARRPRATSQTARFASARRLRGEARSFGRNATGTTRSAQGAAATTSCVGADPLRKRWRRR